MSKHFQKIIDLPIGVNNILLSLNVAPGLIYGKKYLRRKMSIENDGVEGANVKLIKLVNSAITNTPYYKNLYHTPISNIEEFSKTIKFIDRNTLTNHFKDLLSSNIDNNQYLEVTTGGTSGKPVRLLIPRNRHIVELSTMHHIWNRTGWNYDTRAVIRNHKLPQNVVFQINPITKELIFDNFRLGHEYVKQIHKVLLKYKIEYIHAYPSAAYQFCSICLELGLELGFIKAFLCGSEGVLDFQKKLINTDMGLNLFSWYGHSEKLVLGGYCEYTDHFHLEPSYGYFELIGKNNIPVTTPGEFGEIVGTTIHNYGMPLIRYKTGDYAEYVGDHCEKCGRKMPIIKNIQGRWDKNQIFRKDGTYITTTALNLHNDLYNKIEGIQYIQNEAGSLKVLIIKGLDFYYEDEKTFLKHFSEAIGKESSVKIEYVDKLIYQPNGKFLQLVSKLK